MNSPSCPHHPSIPMRLVPSGEPLFVRADGAFSNAKREKKRKKEEMRLIYRCGAEGCPRVEPKPREPETYPCRVPGCKNLADPEKAMYGEYTCRKHYLTHWENRKAMLAKKHSFLDGWACSRCGGRPDRELIARRIHKCRECYRAQTKIWNGNRIEREKKANAKSATA